MIARYARPEMSRIWSEEGKLVRWFDVEIAALEAWAELGSIPSDDVAAIRAGAVPPSPERVAEIEKVTDHDTAAFVDAVAEQLGPEGRWFHYGLTSSDVVDTALARLGKTRRVALMIPHFLAAPMVVARSDLVLTLPERIGRACASMLPLTVVAPPLEVGGFSVSAFWHELAANDPAHAWLRGVLIDVCRTV